MLITTIPLSMPFRMGSVNCYLIEHEHNFLLIDTGSPNQRVQLEQALEASGCKPGNLKLIILTHGDFDHAGNAAHLGRKFGVRIAMHREDAGMVEQGDMFFSRKAKPNRFIRWLISALAGFPKSARFKPDLYLADDVLANFGFAAGTLSIPGHSKGSLGVLTEAGDLFCGDLFENFKTPRLNTLMDDHDAARASLTKLHSAGVKMVYPGHGKPFRWELLGFIPSPKSPLQPPGGLRPG